MAETNDRRSQHGEREVRAMRLFIADQQLAKAIELGARDFHDPSPRARATAALRALLAARADVRR